MNIQALHDFIVEAKANCYVSGGGGVPSCRAGSHDHGFSLGEWRYLDSYVGGSDFAGQEIVWHAGEPVWAMNYFGRIVDQTRMDGERAGTVIKAALSRLYAEERRVLGGTELDHTFGRYVDRSQGDITAFRGREIIVVDGLEVYDLDYRGGLIRH
nr:DUF5680 domain-containing protein [uncultured Shinella sp.]